MSEFWQQLSFAAGPPRLPPSGMTIESYEYRPLSVANDQIRVLELLPGAWDLPVRIKLHSAFFTEQTVPSYTALSYAWGDRCDRRTIYVYDKDCCCILDVTRSCEEALKFIGKQSRKSQMLWIDAICINQDDSDERSQQVNMMAAIYARAARVIAWLGPASEDSQLAIKWIKDTATRLGIGHTISAADALDHRYHLIEPPETCVDIGSAQMRALYNFLGRPWFNRLWIWQEIKIGRTGAILLCGDMELPLTFLRAAVRPCIGRTFPKLERR